LINGDNIQPTKHPKIFCAFEHKFSWEQLKPMLQKLFHLAQNNSTTCLIQQLQILVPEYRPDPKLLVLKERTPVTVVKTEKLEIIPTGSSLQPSPVQLN
jgi:hypothetical protein